MSMSPGTGRNNANKGDPKPPIACRRSSPSSGWSGSALSAWTPQVLWQCWIELSLRPSKVHSVVYWKYQCKVLSWSCRWQVPSSPAQTASGACLLAYSIHECTAQAFVGDFFLAPVHDDLSARRAFDINEGEGWKEPSILMTVGGIVDLFCGRLSPCEPGEGFDLPHLNISRIFSWSISWSIRLFDGQPGITTKSQSGSWRHLSYLEFRPSQLWCSCHSECPWHYPHIWALGLILLSLGSCHLWPGRVFLHFQEI